ncbi:hypothetical protein ABBQ32_004186 [Trebouxia sp. C0010 RCD-2024]
MSNKIARSLQNMSHLRQVYAAITKMMHRSDFLDQSDTNVDLLAFKDGVLHLPTKQCRKGQPQDMLSVCAPYNFPTTDATKREELQLFLSQIKPQDGERDYLMDQFSRCLSGRVRKQLVHIFAGPLAGNSQRSAPANNANSIILDCKRARIVGLSEPEEGARFNAANLKALSGGDKQNSDCLSSATTRQRLMERTKGLQEGYGRSTFPASLPISRNLIWKTTLSNQCRHV